MPALRLRRPGALLAAASFALALAGPATTASASPAPELLRPDLPGRLSDERTLTRWATALTTERVRRAADPRAAGVARLRFHTEDRLPEVYVGLERALGKDGREWVRVRVPMRPNGTTGWVPRSALNHWRTSQDLLWVSPGARRAVLFREGRPIWRSPVGIGKPGTPTPNGDFYVRERIRNLGGAGVYGPVAFGTSAYSRLSDWPGGGVIGVHGTDRPELIPGRVSHGCVRVPNAAIRRLARLLTVGTPVEIGNARPEFRGSR